MIWATLWSFGVGLRLIKMLQNISESSQSAVRVDRELGDGFKTTAGTRQGDSISPTIFRAYLERVLDPIKDNGTGVSIHGHMINYLKFADDIDLLEEDREELQENLKQINEAGEAAGL